MISREEAMELVKNKVKDERLMKHLIAVEAIMRSLARRLGEDHEVWGLAGLLHDIDYEDTKSDIRIHGLRSAEMLKGLLPEDVLNAIRAHNRLTGFNYKSGLAKALRASDQVSGLIIATALVMPHKEIGEVKVKSLLKKFGEKDFARSIDRDYILLCEELGLSLEEFMEISLGALKGMCHALGL